MDMTAKKGKRVQLTNENKLKVWEIATNNVPKSVKMSQFSRLWKTFWEAKGKFQKFKGGKEEIGLTGATKTAKK